MRGRGEKGVFATVRHVCRESRGPRVHSSTRERGAVERWSRAARSAERCTGSGCWSIGVFRWAIIVYRPPRLRRDLPTVTSATCFPARESFHGLLLRCWRWRHDSVATARRVGLASAAVGSVPLLRRSGGKGNVRSGRMQVDSRKERGL